MPAVKLLHLFNSKQIFHGTINFRLNICNKFAFPRVFLSLKAIIALLKWGSKIWIEFNCSQSVCRGQKGEGDIPKAVDKKKLKHAFCDRLQTIMNFQCFFRVNNSINAENESGEKINQRQNNFNFNVMDNYIPPENFTPVLALVLPSINLSNFNYMT